MQSPPLTEDSVSIAESEYSNMYDMLMEDLETYMEMFMPVEVARRMLYYLVAKGHTGLVRFLRGLGTPPSPTIAAGLKDNLNKEQEATDTGK